MKILLADDDRDLADLVTFALLRQGHQVVSVSNGNDAIPRWRAEQPDLLLLDVSMPGMTGLDVCQEVRQTSAVPIILMSGHCNEGDLVRGYECGADHYIAKPFSPRQLLLRIDALMRRVTGGQSERSGDGGSRIAIGDLLIDRAAFQVHKNGRRVTLTRLEFRILYCLARSAGVLVEIERLADYAWQSPAAGDARLLKTHLSHIRQKLAEAGGDLMQIRAVPRTGYIFSVAVAKQHQALAS